MNSRPLEAGVRRARATLQGLFQWTQRLRAGLLGMNNMLMGTGAVMVGAGIAARSAVRSYERFSNANARLRGILASTGSSMRLQTGMLASAEVAARQYGFGIGESTEAMGTLLETGVQAHEAMRYFGTISQFAAASNSDLESATQVVVDSMRQFNDQSEEGAQRLAATITVAARMSSTSIPQLQQAFRYAGVELSAMGFQADEVASALGALSSIGLRGTTAGTRLRGAMLALTRITGRSRDVMRDNNLEHERLDRVLYNNDGSLRRMTEVSDELTGIFEDLPTHAARLTLATALFGRRAYAAGVILSGLHPRANDFRNVLEELSDSEENVARMSQAAEENTRGFGAQLRFARVAVEQFGITFMQMLIGPFEEANGGFGEYLSNLALAVRGADENTEMTGIMLEQYSELTPELRQSGREFRRTLEGLAELLRILGRIGLAVGRFTAEWPRLSIALLAVGSIIRPLITVFGAQMVAAMGRAAIGLNALTIKLTSFTIAGHAAGTSLGGMIAFWVMAIPAALALGDVLGAHVAEAAGLGTTYEEMGRQTDEYLNEAGVGWLTHIPILNRAARSIGRIVLANRELSEVNDTLEAQRASTYARETAPVNERIARRETQVRRSEAGRSGREAGYARMRATNLERRQDLQRLIVMSAREGNTAAYREAATMRALRRGGMSDERVEGMRGEVQETIRQFDQLGLSISSERDRYERTGHSVDGTAASLRLLTIASEEATSAFRRGALRGGGELAGLQSTRGGVGGDVVVGSSGYLPFPVTAGDVLIHRNELARAMAGAPGALVQPPPPQQVSATPQGDGGGGGTFTVEETIEIPVVIDGREIARAVGRHTLDVDQRRGASIRPGSRRRVAEAGVQ